MCLLAIKVNFNKLSVTKPILPHTFLTKQSLSFAIPIDKFVPIYL